MMPVAAAVPESGSRRCAYDTGIARSGYLERRPRGGSRRIGLSRVSRVFRRAKLPCEAAAKPLLAIVNTAWFCRRPAWTDWCRVLAGLLVTALTGCATTDPTYVFAEQGMAPPTAASAPLPAASVTDLGQAIALAREAQRQWAESARGEADRKRAVSAGLIGLSAVALIKGVTSPNAKDLAGIGAAGAGLYAWGSTMTSSARNAIYREGIASLACAVEAVAPYSNPQWLGTGNQPAISKLIEDAQTAESRIDDRVAQLQPLNVSRERIVPGRVLPAACSQLKTTNCTAAPTGSPQAQLCEQLKSDCVPRATSTVEEKPHPDLTAALKGADDEKSKLQSAVDRATARQGEAVSAGAWLWRTGVEIEQRVREGVQKTEPDLATVLSVSQALKSPPSSTMPPATGTNEAEAHGGAEAAKPGERTAPRPIGIDGLWRDIETGRQVRRALERRLRILESALASSRSESCRRVLPLSFEPAGNRSPTTPESPPRVTQQPTGGAPESPPRTLPRN